MLLQLDIHNIALIEEVSIELHDGLNIITGETGAGKSIIIDSINAVLGERVSRDIIRTGSDKALVEAVFQFDGDLLKNVFEEMGMEPEEDGTLILSREITQTGRNTCRINVKMVSVSYLKEIGQLLIDLHGQHDNQSLLRAEKNIRLLDAFGGDSINRTKTDYLELLEQYKETRAMLKSLSGDPGERERRIDLLKYQIDEIRKAKLKNGEEDDLNKQKMLLSNAEKITGSLSYVYNLLSNGEQAGKPAIDIINDALSYLNSITRLEESYEAMHKRLQDILYQMDDLTEELRRNIETIEYNPSLLEEIDERLDLIYKLKRKYGDSITEIHKYCAESEKQLEELVKSEETINILNTKKTELESRLYDVSVRLNAKRAEAASILEKNISGQLEELEMKKARFKVDIQFDPTAESKSERKYTHNGLDKVEFLISANAGEPLKPLSKIASGGEMSRVMLAIKTILAEVDNIPTMIFDEIDIGISGKAAQKVGEKLSLISRSHQVICVTHLAQIACMADNNFLIEKIIANESTRTAVSKLNPDTIIKEIARLIGGSDTSHTSLKYAQEMINSAKKLRKA